MEKVRLGDVCTINGGYAFKSDQFSTEGVPVIRIGNITKEGLIIDEDVCYDENFWNENDSYRIAKNDILIAMSGATVGKSCINNTERKLLLNQRVAAINCDNNINLKYIFYSIDSEKFSKYIMTNSIGCAQPNISLKQIANFEIPAVCVEEQNRIAGELDKVTDVINKRKQQISKLDELVKSQFVEMFGDPVGNTRNLPKKTLPELGEFGRGVSKHRPRNAPELLGGKYPLIQTGEVANAGLYITSYENTYSELGFKQSKMWDAGTLCITIAANIAKTAILAFDACFPDSVVGFNANEQTNNIFIHYWFSFFQAILEAQAPESAQKNINLKVLSELEVIVPPIEEQMKFVSFVAQTDKSKLEVQKSLEKLELLKKALMQKYFG